MSLETKDFFRKKQQFTSKIAKLDRQIDAAQTALLPPDDRLAHLQTQIDEQITQHNQLEAQIDAQEAEYRAKEAAALSRREDIHEQIARLAMQADDLKRQRQQQLEDAEMTNESLVKQKAELVKVLSSIDEDLKATGRAAADAAELRRATEEEFHGAQEALEGAVLRHGLVEGEVRAKTRQEKARIHRAVENLDQVGEAMGRLVGSLRASLHCEVVAYRLLQRFCFLLCLVLCLCCGSVFVSFRNRNCSRRVGIRVVWNVWMNKVRYALFGGA